MQKPLIIAFVADLFFSMRIESVVNHLGFDFELIESAGEITPVDDLIPHDRPGEAVHGREGALIQKITARTPGLMIFDLNNQQVPWKAWIALLKSSAATRRIPIMAFGSHKNTDMMAAAKEAGADPVLARSRFTSEMPRLIEKHLRIPNYEAIRTACQEPLSALAVEGLDLFNKGDYFEAHEVLEDAWNEDNTAATELYRAILQVGVAYLQIERGNYRGAVKMFLRARQWLAQLPDTCRGVDIARLKTDAARVEAALMELGPENIGSFDSGLFQPVRMVK